MRFILLTLTTLIGLISCGIKEPERKPYTEPTGLLLWLIIISFGIAVISAAYLIFSEKSDEDKSGVVAGVGTIFLIVSLLLLTTGC